MFVSSCTIFIHGDKPNDLYPPIVFDAGASFLENTSSLALKGRIEFKEGRNTRQSGSFQLFLNGPDSASFLIEGPLGADAFRMVVLGDAAHVLTNDGWMRLKRRENIAVTEYGIENISPFLIGPLIFPQYYPSKVSSDANPKRLTVEINDNIFISNPPANDGSFDLFESQSGMIAKYTGRKEFETGFYPSHIEVFRPDSGNWRIVLKITRIRKDPEIPVTIWATD